VLLHLFGDPHRLFDQRLHDLRLRHRLDDLALDEDLPLAVARRHAQIGLTGLTRTVDDTAHHRHPQRHVHPRQTRRDLLGQLVHIHLRPPARRTRHDLQPPLPQPQRLQDLIADLDLLHRRRRQRHPDRVPDPLRQQRTERHRRLHRLLERRTRLRHPQMQGVVATLGQLPVRLDHHHRVVVLHRDLDVPEPVLLEQRRLPPRRLHQRLRRARYAPRRTPSSLSFPERFLSRTPCSSNRDASHSAASTSASGVALPYFCSSRRSSDPAFTPIRIGVPRSPAAFAISLT